MMAKSSMRRRVRGLTAPRVESAGPGKHHDGQGLTLRVRLNGSRQWVQRITVHGRRAEMGLGARPVVTLAEARAGHWRTAGSREGAATRWTPRREACAVITFADAVERCLTAKLEGSGNERHRRQWRATVDAYAMPALG